MTFYEKPASGPNMQFLRSIFPSSGSIRAAVQILAGLGFLLFGLRGATDAQGTQVAKDKKESTNESRFVRLLTDEKGRSASLDTEIVSYIGKYANGKEVQVDLIATIHVADEAYYQELNRQFRNYDAVLYELVAPEDMRVPAERESGSVLSGFQLGMADMLELEFQLDEIDYQAPNFVHADMTPEEFAISMRDRGETPLTMLFQVLKNSLREQAKNPLQTTEKELLLAFFSPDRARELKKIVAHEFSDVERMVAITQGPDGSTLLTERNKKALTVLRKEIAKGSTKMAIYYGAAHMPDFAARLREEFGLKEARSQWLAAWDLNAKKPKGK
jgi:hypothetical protein